MIRKLLLCLVILIYGVLIDPDVSGEQEKPESELRAVPGVFFRSAMVGLNRMFLPLDLRVEYGKNQEESSSEEQKPVISNDFRLNSVNFAYSHIVLPLSEKYGVDWRLVTAVMQVESSFNSRAVSPKGAVGLMQLMPATAALYQVKSKDLYNPHKNVEAGVRHLKMLHDRYDGNLELVIAAYNSGEGAVDRYRGVPPYKHTRAFVKKVMSTYNSRMKDEG